MTKRIKTIIVITVLLLIVIGIWAWIIRSTQTAFEAEKPLDDVMSVMPLSGSPLSVEVAPGLRFKFDTGADISSITKADLEKLRAMGCEIKESHMPIMGRDGYGKHVFSFNRATVTLPIGGYKIVPDSTGKRILVYTGHPSNKLHNVDFVVTDREVSSFGLDFLKKVKSECIYDLQAVEFTENLPEGYQKVSDVISNANISDYFWSPDRCYVTVSVNDVPHIYLLDTGLQKTSIKMPGRDASMAKHQLRPDTIRSMIRVFNAQIDDNAWVNFGNRSGSMMVCYYDNTENEYQLNPLNLFQQDILIDIAGKAIYFRPTNKDDKSTLTSGTGVTDEGEFSL